MDTGIFRIFQQTSLYCDTGSDGTFTAVRGSGDGVRSSNNSSGSGVYVQEPPDGSSNVGTRPGRPADGGVYRPSSYGPRGAASKTGMY